MPISSPFVIVLSDADRRVLQQRARSGRSEHREWLRAQIILAAADQETNAAMAVRLGICVDTARKWPVRWRDGQG